MRPTTASILPITLEEKILNNMETYSSHDNHDVTELIKKPSLKLIRRHFHYHHAAITRHPFVYVGSELDVESPLFLGFTNIVLIDPVFSNAEKIIQCIKRLEQYVEPAPAGRNILNPLSFEGTLRGTSAPVTVTMIPKVFQDRELSTEMGVELYQPTAEIKIQAGVLFSFMLYHSNWLTEPSTWDEIRTDGYLFCNQIPDKFRGSLRKIDPQYLNNQNVVFAHLDREWSNLGKKAIQLGERAFDGRLVQNGLR